MMSKKQIIVSILIVLIFLEIILDVGYYVFNLNSVCLAIVTSKNQTLFGMQIYPYLNNAFDVWILPICQAGMFLIAIFNRKYIENKIGRIAVMSFVTLNLIWAVLSTIINMALSWDTAHFG